MDLDMNGRLRSTLGPLALAFSYGKLRDVTSTAHDSQGPESLGKAHSKLFRALQVATYGIWATGNDILPLQYSVKVRSSTGIWGL